MRAGRLIAIILLMQNNGKMTSKELAEKLEEQERPYIAREGAFAYPSERLFVIWNR